MQSEAAGLELGKEGWLTSMPCFRHDDIEFYFEEHGNGQPFIFSHGLGGDLNQVLELLGDLPDTRLIVYDNRAHGRTRPLGDPAKLRFDVMANDMAALLDHLNVSWTFVGGVSMGAGISLAFGSRYPQRVSGLVLSRPAWLDAANPPHLFVFPVIAKLVAELGLEQARREFEQTGFYKDLRKDYPASAESLSGLFATQNREALMASFQAIPASIPVDSLERFRAVDIPTLVLANRSDPIHPFELAEALANKLPGSRFHEFASKSESPTEHCRQFRRLVAEFLGTARSLSGNRPASPGD
jgi:pimeloyl-ACP methyl ester carboxylesterase